MILTSLNSPMQVQSLDEKERWEKGNIMAKRKYLDITDYRGAMCVLENYLEGAIADYENGDVENDYLIDSCIKTMKLIYSNTLPLLLYGEVSDYEQRYLTAKEKLNGKLR